MQCRHCGGVIEAERSELGYGYCTRHECVAACLEPLDVVAVGVNKASDQYVLKRDLGWTDPSHRPSAPHDGGWLSGRRSRKSAKWAAAPSTSARIAALEAELEAALAGEDDPKRRAKLVNDFNARLRRLNIRYRRTAQRRT